MGKAILLACIVLALVACAKAQEPKLPPLTSPEISGDRLWKRITEETDFDTYSFWPGHEGMRAGQSPHGKFHEVYINATLAGSLPLPGKVVPDGGIIVKENFSVDKKPAGLTVMVKVRGYNPEHADWFWAKFDPGGKVLAEGKVKECIECHEGVKDNDYVIIRPLDEPLPTAKK